MKRRNVLGLIGGAAAAMAIKTDGRAARATPLLGILMAGLETAPDNQKRLAAFRQGLGDHGWNEGDNLHIEYRWSSGKDDLIHRYAAELVALKPDVILANSTPVISQFKALTTDIPIVFALDMDPVGMGHVKSLSHPGGNFTGFTFIDPELIGKWMELLKAMAPSLASTAVLFNPATTPSYDHWVREIAANPARGAISIAPLHAASAAEIQAGINMLAQKGGSGVIIGPDPFNQVFIKQLAQLTREKRVPAVSVYRPFVTGGGLMAYGPDTADVFRRSAGYVDRILKGDKPADLPVQEPTKFEFSINQTTAKALGINVPPTLLAIADDVIE